MVAEFDTEKFYLSVLCSKRHDWNLTGKSLRYKLNYKCVVCHKIRSKLQSEQKKESNRRKKFANLPVCPYPRPNFNADKYYLGGLCSRGHNFCNGLSLRTICGQTCYQCRLEFQKTPAHRAYQKEWRKPFREKDRLYSLSKYYEKHENNKEKSRIRARQRRVENPEALATAKRKYRFNHPERVKAAQFCRRSRKRQNHKVKWSSADLAKRFESLGKQCIYCGSKNDLTVDHFLPVSMGGADCLSNFVLACRSCNSSKNNRDPVEWLKSKPFGTPAKIKALLKALGKTEKNYNQIPLF